MHSGSKLSFRVEDRTYYHHRPEGCTVILVEHKEWPGNEFGLWLPERALGWNNWESPGFHQEWIAHSQEEISWSYHQEDAGLISRMKLDDSNGCIWYCHEFTNISSSIMREVGAQTCLHLVNAPEFISIHGERIWACLDGGWKTTYCVPREKSLDPNRVMFLREGAREERKVTHSTGFPYSIMPEAACHPLIMAESFDGTKSIGIACKDMGRLFNNNDYILRCIHSEPIPIKEILPGETLKQEGVILFLDGDHLDLLERYKKLVPDSWWE